MCKKKCGMNINLDDVQSEAKEELRIMNEKD